MRLFSLKVTILAICLIPVNILNAQENPIFNIGYYDLEEDIRYDIWGVHPVDIRSNTNQLYKRPVAGAELGLKDIKPFQRMSKVKFNLVKKRIKPNEEAAEAVYKHIKENNIKFILLDFPVAELLKITNKINDLDITAINVSSKNNELRSSQCNKNLFHTIPSERMLSDSLAQYLSEKKWRKVLVLTGPLDVDKAKSKSFVESAKQFGLKITDQRNRQCFAIATVETEKEKTRSEEIVGHCCGCGGKEIGSIGNSVESTWDGRGRRGNSICGREIGGRIVGKRHHQRIEQIASRQNAETISGCETKTRVTNTVDHDRDQHVCF